MVDGLSHSYRSREVLRDLTFRLQPGTVGLLGPNGAGKTTLMRVLARSVSPDRGAVRRPRPTGDVDPVGYLPQDPALLRHFTAQEFVEYVAWLRRVPAMRAASAAGRALRIVGLKERSSDKIRRLSGGMRQRVGLAASVVNEPKLLLLDEPTNGLDLEQRLAFRELVGALAPDAITVISSHLTEDIAPVCTDVLVLRDGRLAFEGSLRLLCGLGDGDIAPTVEQLNTAYLFHVRS